MISSYTVSKLTRFFETQCRQWHLIDNSGVPTAKYAIIHSLHTYHHSVALDLYRELYTSHHIFTARLQRVGD